MYFRVLYDSPRFIYSLFSKYANENLDYDHGLKRIQS